jgi:predicted Zn-dependent protease with MMP-like domain
MDNDSGIIDDMSTFQLSRWLALFDGINIISEKAEISGEIFNRIQIKHPALEDYVDSTSVLIYRELNRSCKKYVDGELL